jgi:hypothetical protein
MMIVDGTAAHLRAFYGYVPRGRFWVALEGERVVATAGYKIDKGRVHVFACLNDEIRRHPIKMMRCGRALMREASAKSMPVYALADESVPRSGAFLERLAIKECHA